MEDEWCIKHEEMAAVSTRFRQKKKKRREDFRSSEQHIEH